MSIRLTRTAKIGAVLAASALGVVAAVSSAGATTTQLYPTYQLDKTGSLNSALRGDIAGTAFVDKDGQFHWISSYATYDTTDTGSDTNTFTNSDLGALNNQIGSGTTEVTADTYWNRTGSLCYQIDKAASHPAPSPYEDDHCDVVGMWVDPATGTWYGVVNDEYDFDPWTTGTPTTNQRIQTGEHGNRILTASSTDKGKTWTYGGEIITSPFTDHDAFDATVTPGKTWNYGVAGCRLFVDYSTGYFYVVYNTSVKMKPGLSTVATWPTLARAPISGHMAPGTWNKYDKGNWLQPGVGGEDGAVGNPLNLDAKYTPAADQVDFTGTGADGKAVDFRTIYPAANGNTFTFADANGATYTANTSTGVITNSTGSTVPSVTYQDPALNSSVTVSTSGTKIAIAVTNSLGTTQSSTVSNAVLEDTTTHRVYLPPNVVQESALTLNTFTEKYLSVGYDTNAYQTADLGKPNSLSIVGADPSGATSSYLTSLDAGSLTNQSVSSRSYRLLSALNGGAWDITMVPHASGQTNFAVDTPPVDSTGTAVSPSSNYGLAVGGTTLADSGQGSWQLVPVQDPFDSRYRSGFYKIQNVATGKVLQSTGSTVQQTRAVGSAVQTGGALANFDPNGNGGNGAPGGADQWYFQPIGKDSPLTLSSSSSASDIAAATNTSIAGIGQYKLVNRNSGLVLEYVSGQWKLAGQSFGDAGQALTISKL